MPNLKKIKVDQSTISLGFLGTLDLWSNQYSVVLLIRKILPELRKKLPDRAIQLIVIGRNPPKTLRHLAKNDSLVIVTGTVDSTADYLQKIDIMVLPIFEGAGTKLRCLEAMAAGIPIVGTELAFEGITGIIHGINASIAKDIDAFPQNIVDLVEDQDLRQKYSLEGRKLIEECYSWDDITKQLSQELFHLLVTG